MNRNVKTKNEKIATTETQKDTETQNFSPSADGSAKFSASVVARETLLNEIAKLKERLEEYDNKYKRALADYQNLEKRVAEERKEWILKANKDLLLHLLPVLDTLMSAQNHVKDEGLTLSIKQFQGILKAEGVEKIEVVGRQFDPHSMQCTETVEGEEGKVIEEIRTGYMLYDQVLRPAQVAVGKGSMSS